MKPAFKRVFKYTLLCILCLWLLVSTFLAYILLRNTYADYKYDQLKASYESNPANYYELKDFTQDSLFINRITACKDQAVLKLLQTEQKLRGYEKTISAGKVNTSVINSFKTYFINWPQKIKAFCDQEIGGVYSVKNLSSSALTISNAAGRYIIFINEQIFEEKANDWSNRIESMPIDFQNSSLRLNHIIENDSSNTPSATLENILLHEIGHCMGDKYGLTPSFSHKVKETMDFFKDVYSVSYYELMPEEKYKDLQTLKFYSDEDKISTSALIELLRKLEGSPFPTLYSAQNEFEFFAEYFYSYLHCIVQKKPFKYRVYEGNNVVLEVENNIYKFQTDKRYEMIKNLVE
jgi:hypothetical protein